MERTWKRLVILSLLGGSIAGGVGVLAVVIHQAEANRHSQLERGAQQQAGLAANLIDSVLPAPEHGGRTPGWGRLTVAHRAVLDRYLRDVARFGPQGAGAQMYLINQAGDVIAGGAPAAVVGPAAVAASAAVAERPPRTSLFTTSAALTAAPWRVVYSIPTRLLGGTRELARGLSLVLLACFGTAAVICLFLLIRLLSRTGQLARANRALADRNRELQSATEAKSRFVATMSHELRNPLNAVIGFAELMHDGRLGPLAPGQRKHLGVIRSSGEHVLGLINDFLDMARIEAGRIRLEPKPIEPASIAAECATSLGRLAAAKAIHINLDPRPVGSVLLDPARLRQLLLNYLSNAIKFTGQGGTIGIRLERLENELRIAVADNGPGIEPEDQSRVFDEFFQAANRDRTGSGLGLSITKRIVEAQGGTVGVRSAPGQGSTFYATLPTPAVPESVWLGVKLDAAPGIRRPERIAAGEPRVLAPR
jgi:signal transduction histidine kinase